MSTPEGLVKKHIKEALAEMQAKGLPLWFYMPVGGRFGKAGIPDFCGHYTLNGVVVPFGIEAKAAGGKTTALQDKALADARAAGGNFGIIKPHPIKTIKEQVYEFIYT